MSTIIDVDLLVIFYEVEVTYHTAIYTEQSDCVAFITISSRQTQTLSEYGSVHHLQPVPMPLKMASMNIMCAF